jgi:hypothetical protein
LALVFFTLLDQSSSIKVETALQLQTNNFDQHLKVTVSQAPFIDKEVLLLIAITE